MQLVSKYNKEFWFLLYAINIFIIYVWVASLKDRKVLELLMLSQKFFNESAHKPNKIWLDGGSEFYNR